MTSKLIGNNLTVTFGSASVLTDISIELVTGQFLGLVGASGCGKTTLARVLSGKLAPDAGQVLLDNTPLSFSPRHRNTQVATIHQSPRLACNPAFSLRQIIAEPIVIARRYKDQTSLDAEISKLAAAAQVDEQLLDRRPAEVSDGQLQRACIARALAQQARFLVCDEPTSMLDPLVTASIVQVLRAQAESGVGILFISHNQRLLHACADNVISMENLSK